MFKPNAHLPAEVEEIAGRVVDAAFAVHQGVRPGCKETAYVKALCVAFRNRGLAFDRERWLSLDFEGTRIERVGQPDFIVEDAIILEVKAVETVLPVHLAQVKTYVRLSGLPVGFLVNFHEPYFKAGVHRLLPPTLS